MRRMNLWDDFNRRGYGNPGPERPYNAFDKPPQTPGSPWAGTQWDPAQAYDPALAERYTQRQEPGVPRRFDPAMPAPQMPGMPYGDPYGGDAQRSGGKPFQPAPSTMPAPQFPGMPYNPQSDGQFNRGIIAPAPQFPGMPYRMPTSGGKPFQPAPPSMPAPQYPGMPYWPPTSGPKPFDGSGW